MVKGDKDVSLSIFISDVFVVRSSNWEFVKYTWEIDGKQCQTLFFGAPKSLQMVTAAMKLKDAYSLEGRLCPT